MFSENYNIMKEIHSNIKKITKSNKNDEGAWESNLNEEQVLEILSKFPRINIGIDIASSSFFRNRQYNYSSSSLDRKSQIIFINSLIHKFKLAYIEDPLEENDFSGFSKISKSALVCGDDLTVTDISRLNRAIKNKSINAMIIKPNQNGSLLELNEIADICRKNRIKTIISHRSGETLDSALADYAFAFQADYIKCGISTKWREAKLKRLIEIEKSIKKV